MHWLFFFNYCIGDLFYMQFLQVCFCSELSCVRFTDLIIYLNRLLLFQECFLFSLCALLLFWLKPSGIKGAFQINELLKIIYSFFYLKFVKCRNPPSGLMMIQYIINYVVNPQICSFLGTLVCTPDCFISLICSTVHFVTMIFQWIT